MAKSRDVEIALEHDKIALYKKNGDLNILGDLYRPYMHLVYGVCLKYLKKREDSQDAVMQIFEKLVDSVAKHDIKNFKSWLYVMTKNHCLMHLRSLKKKNEKSNDQFMENELIMHHNDEAIDEENIEKLEKCIATLQKEQKICVEMFYLNSKSYKEIVEVTSFDLKKVKSYIQNGKRNLKICMEK